MASSPEQLTDISDESDLYGTVTEDDEDANLDAIRKYWAVHHPNAINVLARKQRQRTAEDAAVDAANAQREPCNSFEGLSYAKQFNETVAEFLERMPPVPGFPDIDWLWVENPFPHQQEGDGKVQIGGDVAAAMMQMRMFDYGQKRAAILAETPDICASTLTKDLTNDRKKLRQFILDAARDSGDVSGKWLLFPLEEDVPRYWRTICKAVIAGKLGDRAKIAAGVDPGRGTQTRLICVYTDDFSDIEDVKRVVKVLHDLNLIGLEKSIYYKPDIFTKLGLESQNEYRIKVSLYGSLEFLKEEPKMTTGVGKKRVAPAASPSASTKQPKPTLKYARIGKTKK